MSETTAPLWRPVDESSDVSKSFTYIMRFDEDDEVDPKLHKNFRDSKELMQCLHHAYTYNAEMCALPIGDKILLLGKVYIMCINIIHY